MEIIFDTHGNEKQKLCASYWIDNETSDILYGGAKGTAKSFTGASLIFGDAFIYPETHYFIARKKLNDLRKFTRPSIHEVFKIWGITDNMWKYNGQDNYYTLYNGSKVFFIEAKHLPSDPLYERFGSMQFTRGWIEEAGEFEEAAKNALFAAIGRWKNEEYGLHRKLLQTCNPSKNYLYRAYYKKFRNDTLPDWVKFIQALPQDNKKLDAGYIEHLRQVLSFNERQRLLHGKWEFDDDPNACTTFEAIDRIFDYQKPETWEEDWFITADIAFESDKCVIILWNGLDVVKVYDLPKDRKPEEFIKTLQIDYNVPFSNIVYDGTGAGNYLKNYFPNAYLFHAGGRPVNEEKGVKEFEHLKTQCYWELAQAINENKIRVFDDSLQDEMSDELMQIKTIPRDKLESKIRMIRKEEIKKVLGRSPDILDAMSMRMVRELDGGFSYCI